MADGKPLTVSITQKADRLYLEFTKAGEGLWAEGPASICLSDVGLEVRIASERIKLGPAAPWLLRQSLGHGAKFSLTRSPTGRLRISTAGWSGWFIPG
jgi:hypothetical protein